MKRSTGIPLLSRRSALLRTVLSGVTVFVVYLAFWPHAHWTFCIPIACAVVVLYLWLPKRDREPTADGGSGAVPYRDRR